VWWGRFCVWVFVDEDVKRCDVNNAIGIVEWIELNVNVVMGDSSKVAGLKGKINI